MKVQNLLLKILLIFIIYLPFSYSQSTGFTTISGFVYDKSTGETLIGATVALNGKGVKTGAYTNNNGFFVITEAPTGVDTINVSYIGYDPVKRIVKVAEEHSGLQKFYLTPSAYKIGEVVVTGDSTSFAQKAFDKPISSLSMTAQQVNSIPKIVLPDLLRALQSMPGITALSDFSSAVYIRGGTPDQNLYLIDGAQIYDPEHAFGIFSTFNTDAIKQVNVSKGGFGSQYGDRLSGVIDVIDNEGNRNNFQGTFDLSLIAGNLTMSVPLGSLGSISGSFRRTFIDQTIAKWNSNIPPYYFYDANLKAFLQLGDKDNLVLSYFKSVDNLNFQTEQGNPQSPTVLIDWGNTLGSLNWKHLFSDRLYSSFYATYSGFSSNFGITQVASINESNPLNDYTAREALTYYASNEFTLDAGAEYKKVDISFNRSSSSGLIDIFDNTHETSAYANLEWQPNPLWQVNAGLRFEQFQADTIYTHLDPRLSIKYKLSENSNLKFATGIYHQYMEAVEMPFSPDIWIPSDKNIHDSQAEHYIFGYEQQIGNLLDFETEIYYKKYKNVYIFNYNANAEISPSYYRADGTPVYSSTQNIFTRGDGDAYGLELLLRKDVGAVTGWLGYSYAIAKDIFDGVNQGGSFVPQQSRASVINFVLNGNVNSIFSGKWNEAPEKSSSEWILGLNFIFTSGQPITLPSSTYFVNTLPAWNNYDPTGQKLPSYQLYPGSIDSFRLPDYIRLDLSITWQKDYGSWSIAPYFQIFNVGNRKNVWFINYSSTGQNGAIVQNITTETQLPFLPSLGVTVKF
jgi:hypothetical protein